MKKLMILGIVGALLLLASPAVAAPGGKSGSGGDKNTVTGTIEVGSVVGDVVRAATTTADEADVIHYGDLVDFDVAIAGNIGSRSQVYITVVCMQGLDLAYNDSGWIDATFDLSDQGHGWDADVDASCGAWLILREKQGKGDVYTTLDRTEFTVTP